MSSMVDFMGLDENNAAAESAKKLEELTDADVMQLTREDCRRYLKEKGMRRPSWNKAQVVQQVLSLKSLCHDAANFGGKRGSSSPPLDLEEAAPPSKKGPTEMTSIDLKAAAAAVTADNSQLTMFYDGGVSVFDDVSPDKAYAIMLLAGNVKSWPSINVGATKSGKNIISSCELPQARKASLHRFLQRRREKMTATKANKSLNKSLNKSPAGAQQQILEKHATNDPTLDNKAGLSPQLVCEPESSS